jgi:hypothetical protein
MPRSVADSPAASPSKQSQSRRESVTSFFSCCSVSAVPIEATTGRKPNWRSAITSVFPSTTQTRSSFAIAARARSRPYSTSPFRNSSLSGEFTYFARSGSSSCSFRAWKPSTRPLGSASGKTRRRAK